MDLVEFDGFPKQLFNYAENWSEDQILVADYKNRIKIQKKFDHVI